jgi:hypothetical protein
MRFSLKLFGKFSSHYYPELAPKKIGTGGERIRLGGLFSSGRRLAKFCGRGARRRENLWPIQQRNNESGTPSKILLLFPSDQANFANVVTD